MQGTQNILFLKQLVFGVIFDDEMSFIVGGGND